MTFLDASLNDILYFLERFPFGFGQMQANKEKWNECSASEHRETDGWIDRLECWSQQESQEPHKRRAHTATHRFQIRWKYYSRDAPNKRSPA